MKKLTLALACIIGMMFFASCTPEQIDEILAQKPTVEFVSGDGLISGNTSEYVGTPLNFKVKVAPNASSNSALAHFDFSITNPAGDVMFNENPDFTDPSGDNYFEFTYTPTTATTYVVTATITDAAGKANVAAVTVDYVQPVVEGIGTFQGIINITGHVTTTEIVGYTYDDDYNIENLETTITLGATDDNNHVSATLEIDGTPVTLYGTMDDNTITFDEFHLNRTISLTVDINLDLLMNITGTLDNDVLTLAGTAEGSGSTTVLFQTFEASFNGDVEGSLEKVVVE